MATEKDTTNGTTDKQGRIVDPFNGRPLRDARSRTSGNAPFHGKPGTMKVNKKLEARQKSYDDIKGGTQGRKRPGSQSK